MAIWSLSLMGSKKFKGSIVAMLNFKPRNDHILCRRLPQETHTLVIPEVAQEKSTLCEVLAVGPGRWIDGVFTKTVVRPGHKVIIGPYTDLEQEDLVICQEADIRCLIG
jgi:co-chaperonin GroES (HSP10)